MKCMSTERAKESATYLRMLASGVAGLREVQVCRWRHFFMSRRPKHTAHTSKPFQAPRSLPSRVQDRIGAMPRTASSRKKAAAPAAAAPATATADPEEYSDNEDFPMMFSQHLPEMSQALPEAKDREKQNLDSLDPHVREKLLTTLSRLLLFKALAGETIDKVSEECVDMAEITGGCICFCRAQLQTFGEGGREGN